MNYGILKHIVERDICTGYATFFIEDSGTEYLCCGVLPMFRDQTPFSYEYKEKEYTDDEGRLKTIREVTDIRLNAFNHSVAESYLKGKEFTHIGEVTAKKIVAAMSPELFTCEKTIDEIYDEIKSCGLKKQFLSRAVNHIRSLKRFEDLYRYILSLDGSFHVADALFCKYGKNALPMVKENPYIMMYDGAPISICERAAKKQGFEEFDERRVSAIVYYAMRQNNKNGNTVINFHDLCSRIHYIEKKAKCAFYTSPLFIGAKILSDKYVVTEETNDVFIQLKTDYKCEKEITKSVQRLNNGSVPLNTSSFLSDIEKICKIKYSEGQREAFKLLNSSGIKIITGGPGTGKTTLLNGILTKYELDNPGKEILLCAPTGIASARMAEATNRKAYTIHKLLKIRPFEEYITSDIKLDCDCIVVDECSMVDTALMSLLLSSLKAGTLVILMGDKDQLPSVGAGNVFADLLQSGKIPVYELKVIFRQGEHSTIVENAYKVIHGETDLKKDSHFKIVRLNDMRYLNDIISKMVKYSKSPFITYTPVRKKKFATGEIALNNMIHNILHDRAHSAVCNEYSYSIGDPVVFKRNNYEKGYINGQMGTITAIGRKGSAKYILVRSEGNDYELTGADLYDIMLGFCLTAHKSQGGETDNALIILPKEAGGMLQRQLLYVEITRAKKNVVIITEGDALETAITNDKRLSRRTMLRKMVNQIV